MRTPNWDNYFNFKMGEILFLEKRLLFKLIILRKYMANGKKGGMSTIHNTAIHADLI